MTNRPGNSFLDEIALGRYIEGNTPLHRAHAGPKAVIFSSVAVASFFFQSASAFLILGVSIASLSLAVKLPQALFWRSLRPVNLLAFFTIIAAAFVNHPDASLLAPSFSWQGLHTGGLYAARLVTITLLTTLFFLTTRPDAAIRFGISILKPLRVIGVEKEELSLLVHLAYRFVPLLRREIQELSLGRRARNLPQPKGALARAKQSLDQIVFLFVGALHRAETTGLALQQRRVVEGWRAQKTSSGEGVGGWMSLFLLGMTGLAYWKDTNLW